jgi:NADH-quinone oxidoreductase subunit M
VPLSRAVDRRHRYGALVALAQSDWKRLVAYSSRQPHGMVMLGMFALTPVGITGSIVQQINHGISTGALFLIVGIVYERRTRARFSEYGGSVESDAGSARCSS